jgi:hypothetical protein
MSALEAVSVPRQDSPEPGGDELRPRSPRLLILADHPEVVQRSRAVARALARVLVSRTMLELGLLAANDDGTTPVV